MSWARFDPNQLSADNLPTLLRPLHHAWAWASPQVTGHAAHALNGLLAWLAVGGPLWCPLTKWWVLPVIFYTVREIPDMVRGEGDALDHLGDVNYVYAYALALWLPPDLMAVLWVWVVWLITAQGLYWAGPAPGWMPRKYLLWGAE